MRWYYYVVYFFGGAFLANALPISATESPGTPSGALLHRRLA